MRIRVDLKSWVFGLCMFAPAWYTILECLFDGLSSKVVIFVLVLGYVLLNKIYIKRDKLWSLIAFNSIFFIYVIYIALIENVFSVIHLNFYSYLFLFIMLSLFLDTDTRNEFYAYFLKRRNRFGICIVISLMGIIFSIIFLDGLKKVGGIALPVLYGPFTIPHILAYIMLVIYAGSALCSQVSKSRFWILVRIIAVFCIVWSATRSAALAVAVLIIVDVFSVRQFSKRTLVIVGGIVVLLVVAISTDILINNPLIQKTNYAANIGGSITNGREQYVEAALSYYNTSTSFFQKIIGSGMSAVIESMYAAFRVRIHAHNDYINILVGYGVIGFLIFIITQLKLFKLGQSLFNKLMLQAFIFVLVYFNGLAMYIMFTVSLPIILCFFDKKSNKKNILNLHENLVAKKQSKRNCGAK